MTSGRKGRQQRSGRREWLWEALSVRPPQGVSVAGAEVTAVIKIMAPPVHPTISIPVTVPITVPAIVCPVAVNPVAALLQAVGTWNVTPDVGIGELLFIDHIPIISQASRHISFGTRAKGLINVGCGKIPNAGFSIGVDDSCDPAQP
jgi:hypothetical protein